MLSVLTASIDVSSCNFTTNQNLYVALFKCQRSKRVCPICRKFYVYFCIICCTNTTKKVLDIAETHQKSSYLCVAKETIFKLLFVVFSYIFNATIQLTKVIDVGKKKTLGKLFRCINYIRLLMYKKFRRNLFS